jgi:hypothetical protein
MAAPPLKRRFSSEDELTSKLGKYWSVGQEENRHETTGRASKKTRFLIEEIPLPVPRPRERPRPRPRPARAKPIQNPTPPIIAEAIVAEDNLRNSGAVAPPPPPPAGVDVGMWLQFPIEASARAELDAFIAASGTQDVTVLFRRFFAQVANVGVVFPSWKPGSMLKLAMSAAAADAQPAGALDAVATVGQLLTAAGMSGLVTQLDVADVPIAGYMEVRAWFEEQEAFKNLDPAVKRAFALALSWVK